MKDLLYINQLSARNIEVQTGSKKFFDQHRYIEPVRIISSQIAVFDELPDLIGNCLESGSIFYHFISNAMNVGSDLGMGISGLIRPAFNCLISISSNSNDSDLNNPVDTQIDTRSFQVDYGQRPC